MNKICSCCKTKTSELGIHIFNTDELLCGSCDIKRSKNRK